MLLCLSGVAAIFWQSSQQQKTEDDRQTTGSIALSPIDHADRRSASSTTATADSYISGNAWVHSSGYDTKSSKVTRTRLHLAASHSSIVTWMHPAASMGDGVVAVQQTQLTDKSDPDG
jgi:hypothetical protein